MHLLIDLKSPEYLNLPQHFTVSRTLQRATVKKGKFVPVLIIQAFLISDLDGVGRLASRYSRFASKKTSTLPLE